MMGMSALIEDQILELTISICQSCRNLATIFQTPQCPAGHAI